MHLDQNKDLMNMVRKGSSYPSPLARLQKIISENSSLEMKHQREKMKNQIHRSLYNLNVLSRSHRCLAFIYLSIQTKEDLDHDYNEIISHLSCSIQILEFQCNS